MLRIIHNQQTLKEYLCQRQQMVVDKNASVEKILARVQKIGDEAIQEFTKQYDNVFIHELRVSPNELSIAEKKLDPYLHSTIIEAAENIRSFHKKQIPQEYTVVQPDGTKVTYRQRPIKRVGIYIPGGRFPLFSTVLMNVIPAQIAGVGEIAICTPPGKSGLPNKVILATCSLLGVDEIYRIGGAQAIGALAYGTTTIPAVDKITGPGNKYVMAAKHAVSSIVGIDMLAGPTELVVVADDSANPQYIAADLISQAEHDPEACPVLITNSETVAKKVNDFLPELLQYLPTHCTAKQALTNQGFIYRGNSLEDCIEVADQIAPEHLSLQVTNPEQWIDKVKAGAIFIGTDTPVAWGDYWSGANHTLPTASHARFKGTLSVTDFLVPYAIVESSPLSLKTSAKKVQLMAKVEGLAGHAQSVELRSKHD